MLPLSLSHFKKSLCANTNLTEPPNAQIAYDERLYLIYLVFASSVSIHSFVWIHNFELCSWTSGNSSGVQNAAQWRNNKSIIRLDAGSRHIHATRPDADTKRDKQIEAVRATHSLSPASGTPAQKQFHSAFFGKVVFLFCFYCQVRCSSRRISCLIFCRAAMVATKKMNRYTKDWPPSPKRAAVSAQFSIYCCFGFC